VNDERLRGLNRRGFVTAAGGMALATVAAPGPTAAAFGQPSARTSRARPLGSGGKPTSNAMAPLAREHGRGEPLMYFGALHAVRNGTVRAHPPGHRPARRVGISGSAAMDRAARVYRKLGVHRRPEAVTRALPPWGSPNELGNDVLSC
jgi:hypothetical protein